MGGAAAWENADSLEEACQKEGCNNRRIVYAYLNIEIKFIQETGIKAGFSSTFVESLLKPRLSFRKI